MTTERAHPLGPQPNAATGARDPIEQLRRHLMSKRPDITSLPLDYDLLENKVIDSLQFIEFVFFVQELSGQSIPLDEIDLQKFKNLNAIKDSYFA